MLLRMSTSPLSDLLPLNLPLPPQLEQWRQTLLRQLPSPITGEQTLFVGDPLKVIIAFGADGLARYRYASGHPCETSFTEVDF